MKIIDLKQPETKYYIEFLFFKNNEIEYKINIEGKTTESKIIIIIK